MATAFQSTAGRPGTHSSCAAALSVADACCGKCHVAVGHEPSSLSDQFMMTKKMCASVKHHITRENSTRGSTVPRTVFSVRQSDCPGSYGTAIVSGI